jgi:DNA gyrase subunit A
MTDHAKEIIPVNLEDEMRKSYLDYAMSAMASSRCIAAYCSR